MIQDSSASFVRKGGGPPKCYKGLPINNDSPSKGENPTFFYFEFEVLPKVGEMILLNGIPGC